MWRMLFAVMVVGAMAAAATDGEISSVPGDGLQIDFDGAVHLNASLLQSLLAEVETLREEMDEIHALRRQEGLWPGVFESTIAFASVVSPRSNAEIYNSGGTTWFFVRGAHTGIKIDKLEFSMTNGVYTPPNTTADYRPWVGVVASPATGGEFFALAVAETVGKLDVVRFDTNGLLGTEQQFDLGALAGESFPSADMYEDGGTEYIVYTASHATASRVERAVMTYGATSAAFAADVSAADVIGATSSVARCGEFICVASTDALRDVYLSVYEKTALALVGRTLVYSVGADDAGLQGRLGTTNLDGVGVAIIVDISNGPQVVLRWVGGNTFDRIFESKPPYRGSRGTPRFFTRVVGTTITYMTMGFSDGADGSNIFQAIFAWDVETLAFVLVKGTYSPGPAFDVSMNENSFQMEFHWAVGSRNSPSASFNSFSRRHAL